MNQSKLTVASCVSLATAPQALANRGDHVGLVHHAAIAPIER